MTTNKLYDIADNNFIEIDFFQMEELTSASVVFGRMQRIAINPEVVTLSKEERVRLAHELGHCITNSFYNVHSPLDIRKKHENEADKWAIKKLIPKDELKKHIENGYIERWELAELFDVTEDFIEKAIMYYKSKCFD